MTATTAAQKPVAAGFIVYHKWNQETIDGVGPTGQAAWIDFLSTMAMANVDVIDENICDKDAFGRPLSRNYAVIQNYTIRPASQALLDKVDKQGGNIAWAGIGEVCCTVEEMDAWVEARCEEDETTD